MDDRALILNKLEADGNVKLTSKFEALLRPAVLVKAEAVADGAAALAFGASRFGGHPDLPPGVAWPTRAGRSRSSASC